jgi:hypothetical protein
VDSGRPTFEAQGRLKVTERTNCRWMIETTVPHQRNRPSVYRAVDLGSISLPINLTIRKRMYCNCLRLCNIGRNRVAHAQDCPIQSGMEIACHGD